jgi:hypothetical protein
MASEQPKHMQELSVLLEIDDARLLEKAKHHEQCLKTINAVNTTNRAALRRQVPWIAKVTSIKHDGAVEAALEGIGWFGVGGPNWAKVAIWLDGNAWNFIMLAAVILDVLIQMTMMVIELLTGLNCPASEISISHSVIVAMSVLDCISLILLAVFFFDLGMRFLIFGPWYYFGSLLYFLDALVLIAILLLEIFFTTDRGVGGMQIIVVFRILRVIDILYAVLLLAVEESEAYRIELQANYDDAVEEIRLLREYLVLLQASTIYKDD